MQLYHIVFSVMTFGLGVEFVENGYALVGVVICVISVIWIIFEIADFALEKMKR